jgi:anaerobic selenocysteine-containing dehydrogenase
MIDICPVGALTSKPFRYSARTWELSRRKSVSPHDSTGANLIVQVKNHKVMRVVPLENEAVNECWIADRDRFSYEALNSDRALTQPMLKQGGQWQAVDWNTALEYVADGLKRVISRVRQPTRHRRARAAQHARSRNCTCWRKSGAWPGQREHRPPPPPRRLHQRGRQPAGPAGWALRLPRCPGLHAGWWSALSCARITRCWPNACARPCARARS